MVRAPDWNESEFTTLLYRSELDHEPLAQIIGRSPGAIEVVREGVHIFHLGKENHGILSRMMIKMLKEKQQHIRCPKCGIEF